MAQWKKELSADDIRYLIDWFTGTYDEERYPPIWIPSRAVALRRKIYEVEEREAGH